MSYRIIIVGMALLALTTPVMANPTQYGSTGLLSVPSADTLDAGNICVGIWGNCSDGPKGNSFIIPVALTLGIGSFWEFYGTYPNILFNEKEQTSGRGTVDVGTKMRIYGKRSSRVKLAANLFLSRHLDNDPAFDGQTDVGGDLIASLKTEKLGLHVYGGYVSNSNYRGRLESFEYPFGLGFEYGPTQRTKVTLELTGRDAHNLDAPVEADVGFQFFISPHLTFNLASGAGLTKTSQDWRLLFGFTTCQGVGSYIKPIPKVGHESAERKREVVRPTKIIPLSPLLVKVPESTAPASKYEVPVDPDKEEIVIRPYGQILIQQQPAATPVVLPKNILLDQPDGSPDKPADSSAAAMPAAIPSSTKENKAVEYTLSRVSGVTPLYGVDVDSAQPALTPGAGLPVKPNSVSVYKKFRLPDTLFEFGQSELSPEVKKALSEVAELIRKDPKWSYLRIDGHTDSIGSVKYNLDLSLKRAIAVANYLITREGIDPSKIFVKGMGKSHPIAENNTEEGRRLNRRFEILFLVQNGT